LSWRVDLIFKESFDSCLVATCHDDPPCGRDGCDKERRYRDEGFDEHRGESEAEAPTLWV